MLVSTPSKSKNMTGNVFISAIHKQQEYGFVRFYDLGIYSVFFVQAFVIPDDIQYIFQRIDDYPVFVEPVPV